MNEQAINDAYSLFKSKGYNGSLDEFVELISSNQDALNDAYSLFTSGGYNGDIAEFSELIGLKKKNSQRFLLKKGNWLLLWRRLLWLLLKSREELTVSR